MTRADGVISLKSSVFFSRFDEGVVFRGSETPVVFRGKRAHDLVSGLLGRMKGGVTREQLISGLPDPVRIAVERLVGELQSNALLRERDADDPDTEHDLAARFGNLWNYLADHHARPGEALARWRATHFVIGGRPDAVPYAIRALAECAAERISQVGEVAVDTPFLSAIRAEFPRLEVRSGADAAVWHGCETVAIHAGGDRPFAADEETVRNSWYFGLLRGHLCVAFVGGPLDAMVPAWEARMRPPFEGWEQAQLSGQRIALAAAAMTFTAFNRHAKLAGQADWSIPYLVEPSSQITPLRLAGSVKVSDDVVSAAADPDAQPDTQSATFESAAGPLFDPVTGILDEVDDDLPQVPLLAHVLRVTAYDRSELGAVFGWGSSLSEAHRRAIARGLVAHLRSVPAIGDRVSSIAVASTPVEARAIARAALIVADVMPAPLSHMAVINADAVKLAKLFGMVTGIAPMLTGWSSERDEAAVVLVHHEGQVIARAVGPDLQTAAYQALGDACLAVQLPGANATGLNTESWVRPNSDTMPIDGAVIVDLGFTTLRGHLFCAVTGMAQ